MTDWTPAQFDAAAEALGDMARDLTRLVVDGRSYGELFTAYQNARINDLNMVVTRAAHFAHEAERRRRLTPHVRLMQAQVVR